jgi:hypothetical protein
LIEATKAFITDDMEHPSLVFVEVKSEEKLLKVMEELKGSIQYRTFREPLFDNSITALATEPISGDRRRLFAKFQLIN